MRSQLELLIVDRLRAARVPLPVDCERWQTGAESEDEESVRGIELADVISAEYPKASTACRQEHGHRERPPRSGRMSDS